MIVALGNLVILNPNFRVGNSLLTLSLHYNMVCKLAVEYLYLLYHTLTIVILQNILFGQTINCDSAKVSEMY